MSVRITVCALCLLLVAAVAAADVGDVPADALGYVSITSYQSAAVAVGTDEEDWSPAFHEALAECGRTGKPLFVPAGIYKIRQTITVPQTEVLPGFLNPGRLTIRGAGRMQSIIQQQTETENVLDWTGPTYGESFAGGAISDLALVGGRICLNIKWHNQFRLDNCYIAGAQEFGIYAEGWSSRFSNAIVRWCRQAGIRATAHFNDIVIRDCYLSRDRVGISLGSGNGVRIIGCGLESCSDTAVAVLNTSSVTIRDCYFEGNSYPEVDALGEKGPTFPNVVHLDALASNVVVSGCIFRGGKGYWNANQIAIVGGVNHTIRETRFTNCNVAVKLLHESAQWPERSGAIPNRLRLAQNDFHCTDNVKQYRIDRELPPVGVFVAEAREGLLKAAEAAGCVFEPPTLSNTGSLD